MTATGSEKMGVEGGSLVWFLFSRDKFNYEMTVGILLKCKFDKFIEWLVKQYRSSARQLQIFAVMISSKWRWKKMDDELVTWWLQSRDLNWSMKEILSFQHLYKTQQPSLFCVLQCLSCRSLIVCFINEQRPARYIQLVCSTSDCIWDGLSFH